MFLKPPTIIELSLSEQVLAGTEVCNSYVVPNGKKAIIRLFTGSAAALPNAATKLVWDLAGAGEESIWTIKVEGSMPFEKTVIGDGVKKIAICLDNSEDNPLFMSAYAKIEVEA